MAPTRGNLAPIALVVAFVALTVAAGLGWWNFLNAQIVSRGDTREACYLAVAFDDYFELQGSAPSLKDVESFPTRLRFLRIEDGRYLFACGLYGRDLLIIEHTGNGKFDFLVKGNGNL